MVRALASHARGHWFKSSTAHHKLVSKKEVGGWLKVERVCLALAES